MNIEWLTERGLQVVIKLRTAVHEPSGELDRYLWR